MKILITGGTGFIGSALAQSLSQQHPVTVISHGHSNLPGIKSFIGNYYQPDFLNQLNQFDIIFHLAWSSTPVQQLAESEERKLNVKPSIALAEAAKKAGVKYFVFMSSAGTVYGNLPGLLREDMQPQPANTYGKAKLAVESALKNLADASFKTTVFRATNVIGQSQTNKRGQGVIPAIINALEKGETFTQWGDSKKDYVAIQDVVSAMERASLHTTPYDVFNLGSGNPLRVSHIISLIEEALAKKLSVINQPAMKHDVKEVIVDISKIKDVLNWHPEIDPRGEIITTAKAARILRKK